jgi:ABC-2 type transport system permease protein
MTALLARLARQHVSTLVVMALGLGLFEFTVTRFAPEPGELGFLGQLIVLLPKPVVAMMGGELSMASARGVIAFGYIHPFFLTLLAAWTIRLAAGSLAGEIGRGTMDLIAARPVPRTHLVLSAWIAITIGLGVLAGAAWSGTAIGLRLRPLGVSPAEIVPIVAMAWLLFTCWAGIGVFISSVRHDAGSAITWTSGLIAVSFVVEFLARLWPPAAWSASLSLFARYRPQTIAGSGVPTGDVAGLSIVTVVSVVAAVAAFRRRDL